MKNILFDFGGIFVDLDMSSVNMGIQTYLGTTLQALYHRHREVFDGFETGRLSEKEFVDAVAQMGLPKNKIVDIWNSMISGMPKKRIDFIQSLKGQYNIYLYSNINSFHEKEVNRVILKQHRMSLTQFRQLFDDTWFSHDIGFRKPEKEGFEYIIQQTGINPKETLFIDDTASYLEGAKAVGMHTVLHDTSFDIVDVFDSYLEQVASAKL